jgi:glutamate N-acetyltransferase/amino-acid N-acetyltransferase
MMFLNYPNNPTAAVCDKRFFKEVIGFAAFTGALSFLLKDLARMTVLDGEGATKLIEIEVTGAKNDSEAGVVARKISTSNLLKACVHGGDPNWGRVAAAAGASAVEFDPDKVDIFLGGVKVLSGGAGVAHYDTARAKRAFSNPHVYIRVDLKRGRGRAAAWTCDLSKKYVEINAEYST